MNETSAASTLASALASYCTENNIDGTTARKIALTQWLRKNGYLITIDGVEYSKPELYSNGVYVPPLKKWD